MIRNLHISVKKMQLERSYALKGCKMRERRYYIHIVLFEAKFGKRKL